MTDVERIEALEAKVAELERKLDQVLREGITAKTLWSHIGPAMTEAKRRGALPR